MRAGLLVVASSVAGCSLIDAAGDRHRGEANCQDEGCFQAVESETEVTSPALVAVGHVYGDALPDVIVVDGSDSLEVMENVGSGQFVSRGSIQAVGVSWLAIGDFVDDVGNEIIAFDASDQLLVMFGITAEDGGPYTINNTSLDDSGALIQVGDFDGDLLDDIAVLYPGFEENGLHIRFNSGDGFFENPGADGLFSPGLESRPLVRGDFDNDGYLDLLTAQGGNIEVFRGGPAGSFDDFLPVGQFDLPILGAAAFDLTNDQLPELVLAAGGGISRVYFVENDSGGGLHDASLDTAIEEFEIVSESVAGGDFDGDGLRDAVAFNANRQGDLPDAYLMRSLGGDGFDTDVWVFMDDPIAGGAVADVDDDGLSDLVVAVPGQGLIRAYLSRLEPLVR